MEMSELLRIVERIFFGVQYGTVVGASVWIKEWWLWSLIILKYDCFWISLLAYPFRTNYSILRKWSQNPYSPYSNRAQGRRVGGDRMIGWSDRWSMVNAT